MNVQLQLKHVSARLDDSNPRVLIGRDANQCSMATDDSSVSRRHCEIFLDKGKPFVRDFGSSNGTWVDGAPVGHMPIELTPTAQVYVGHVPLTTQWENVDGGRTVMSVQVPAELKALMEARRQQAWSVQSAVAYQSPTPAAPAPTMNFQQPPASPQPAYQPPPVAPQAWAPPMPAAQPALSPQAPLGGLGVGGTTVPIPADLAYRRQGSNNNGVLLVALPGDTFANNSTVQGYLEFTSLDNESVESVTVELVECNKNGPSDGHVWDRMLVRQGPWETQKGDVLPMPFQLRVPPGTSMSGRNVHWEIRGYVDVNWAWDVEATSPINMRNTDIERIRDALGALDYRIVEMEATSLGQHFEGCFQPPAQLCREWGISNINISVEYLGANLKVGMEVEKTSLFKFDKNCEFVLELAKFRAAPISELSQHLKQQIDRLMAM